MPSRDVVQNARNELTSIIKKITISNEYQRLELFDSSLPAILARIEELSKEEKERIFSDASVSGPLPLMLLATLPSSVSTSVVHSIFSALFESPLLADIPTNHLIHVKTIAAVLGVEELIDKALKRQVTLTHEKVFRAISSVDSETLEELVKTTSIDLNRIEAEGLKDLNYPPALVVALLYAPVEYVNELVPIILGTRSIDVNQLLKTEKSSETALSLALRQLQGTFLEDEEIRALNAVITLLIEKGADPDIKIGKRGEEKTILHRAAITPHLSLENLQRLVGRSKNVDVVDRFHNTPFNDAVEADASLKSIDIWLQAGARIAHANNAGDTPYGKALRLEEGHPIRTLISAFAAEQKKAPEMAVLLERIEHPKVYTPSHRSQFKTERLVKDGARFRPVRTIEAGHSHAELLAHRSKADPEKIKFEVVKEPDNRDEFVAELMLAECGIRIFGKYHFPKGFAVKDGNDNQTNVKLGSSVLARETEDLSKYFISKTKGGKEVTLSKEELRGFYRSVAFYNLTGNTDLKLDNIIKASEFCYPIDFAWSYKGLPTLKNVLDYGRTLDDLREGLDDHEYDMYEEIEPLLKEAFREPEAQEEIHQTIQMLVTRLSGNEKETAAAIESVQKALGAYALPADEITPNIAWDIIDGLKGEFSQKELQYYVRLYQQRFAYTQKLCEDFMSIYPTPNHLIQHVQKAEEAENYTEPCKLLEAMRRKAYRTFVKLSEVSEGIATDQVIQQFGAYVEKTAERLEGVDDSTKAAFEKRVALITEQFGRDVQKFFGPEQKSQGAWQGYMDARKSQGPELSV